jgi:hypothetical protein
MDLLAALAVPGMVALLVGAWRLTRPVPRLRIGDRGILDRTLGLGWIGWDEIEGAYQRRSQDQDSVFLRLRPSSERKRRRLERSIRRAARAREDAFDIRLDLSGTDLTPVEIVQEIMARGHQPARPAGD